MKEEEVRRTRQNERNRFLNANAKTRPILISPDDSLIKMLVAFLLQVRIEEAFSVGSGSYRAFNR